MLFPGIRNDKPAGLGRLLPFLRPYLPQLVLISAAALISTAVSLVVPLAAKVLVDEVAVANRPDRLLLLAGVLFALGMMAMGIRSGGQALHAWTTARVLFDIRLSLYQLLGRLSPTYFAATRSGDLLSRLTADVAEAQAALSDGALGLALAVLAASTSAVALFWLSWKLALVSLLLAPALAVSVYWIRPRAVAIARDLREQTADAMAFLAESVAGMAEIQTFGLQEQMNTKYRRLNGRFVRALLRQQALGAVAEGLPSLCLGATTLAVLGLGAGLIQAGELTWGGLVAFLAYQWRFQGPIRGISALYLRIQRARVALGRVMEIADVPEGLRAGGAELTASQARACLSLDAVSYRYDRPAVPSDKPAVPVDRSGPGLNATEGLGLGDFALRTRGDIVLQDQVDSPLADRADLALARITSDLPGGKVTAIVGQSGAGKSTLIRLLLRLLEPTDGAILIGGIPLSDLDGDGWRRHLAVVGQDTFLFHESILDNVRLARPEATDEEVARAIRDAGLEPLVSRLPMGLATVVGERGARLSGGERQRVSLARALLRDPPLLVLDEATAALDPLTEETVWETIRRRHAEDRGTTLVITHRIGSALRADHILVLDHGRLVEVGAPADLAAREGPFATLLAAWSRGTAGPRVETRA